MLAPVLRDYYIKYCTEFLHVYNIEEGHDCNVEDLNFKVLDHGKIIDFYTRYSFFVGEKELIDPAFLSNQHLQQYIAPIIFTRSYNIYQKFQTAVMSQNTDQ